MGMVTMVKLRLQNRSSETNSWCYSKPSYPNIVSVNSRNKQDKTVSIGIQNSRPQTNIQHDGGDAKHLHTIYNKHWKQVTKSNVNWLRLAEKKCAYQHF